MNTMNLPTPQNTKKEKKKKKIVIATDNFTPAKDGITRFLETVVQELSAAYDLIILAPSYDRNAYTEKSNGATIVRFPTTHWLRLGGYPAVLVRPSTIEPYVADADVVWINSISPFGLATLRAARRHHKPVITYKHIVDWEFVSHILVRSSRPLKMAISFVMRQLVRWYNQCDLIMVSSKKVAKTLDEKGITAKKVIVPLGVECERFIPPLNKAAAKQKLDIPPRKLVIGYCGRISKEKDLPTLAKAFAALQRKHLNLFLLVVGDGTRSDVTKHVKRDVKITGLVDDVVPYLQAMDLFVIPSLTETTSLATLEAMSCGVPPVATPVGHIPEYIEHNFNGVLFPRQNVDVLEARLERLITRSEIREQLGKLARKTVVTRYSWEKTMVAIDRVLSRY